MTTTNTASPELPDLDERAEFEAAQRKYHWPLAEADLRQDKIGNYYNQTTQANWSMWQTRAALARRAQPEGESAACKGCNGHGMVGNILDTDVCPFCQGSGQESAPVPAAQHAESGKEAFSDWEMGLEDADGNPLATVRQDELSAAADFIASAALASVRIDGKDFRREDFVAFLKSRRGQSALAAQQATAPGALYSYMGESGRYELLGHAVGAGKCKLVEPLAIYRDTATGNLYFRAPADFAERMEPIEDNTPEFGGIKTNAPGTPEVPVECLTCDAEYCARCPVAEQRAAQLDRGQEGSE